MYFHPGNKKVVRSYGYVKNVVYQVMKMFEAEPDKVSAKVYYVGDEPIELLDWVNGFSLKQTGKKVRVVPDAFVRILALVGDALGSLRIRFPITSSRYKSMTTSNDVLMSKTIDAFGLPPYSLNEAIDDTVAWLRIQYPEIVKTR